MRVCLCLLAPGGVILTSDFHTAAPWAHTGAQGQALLATRQASAARVGIAGHPLLARWAAHGAAPGQCRLVPADAVAGALAAVPLAGLPGLTHTHQADLAVLRVATLGELAAIPSSVVGAVFGRDVLHIQMLARGADPASVPLAAAWPAPPALTARRAVARTAAPCTAAALEQVLSELAGELAGALTADCRAAQALTVTVGYADLVPELRPVTCLAPAASAAALRALAAPALHTLIRARRRAPTWIAVSITHLVDPVDQPPLPLWPAADDPAARLQAAIADVQRRFGAHVLKQGVLRPTPAAPCKPAEFAA